MQSQSSRLLRACYLAGLLILASVQVAMTSDDHKHAQALKDFVPDHPHLHELVDKTHQGDTEAKHRYEREALAVRFNATRTRLPANTDEEHVVLHFLDDYTAHVTGGNSDHKFMDLEPFISMLGKHDDLREKLIALGKQLENAECDFDCMGSHLTEFMNDAMMRMTGRDEL